MPRRCFFHIQKQFSPQNFSPLSAQVTPSLVLSPHIFPKEDINGYSREKLAELVGITPKFCYDLELGLKNMSVNTLYKLSNALHVSVDYILKGTSESSGPYDSFIGIISLCPTDKLDHLEKIIVHYIQAIQSDSNQEGNGHQNR